MLTIEAIAKIAYNARCGVLTLNQPQPAEAMPPHWDQLPPEHADRSWAMTTAQAEIDGGVSLDDTQAFIHAGHNEGNVTPEHAAFLMTVHTLKPMLSGYETVGG